MNASAVKKPIRELRADVRQVIFKDFSVPLWVALACFFALILLRDIGGVSVPRLLITALCGLFFLVLPENEDYALLFAVIPFSSRISFNEITLIFLFCYVIRRFRLMYPKQIIFWVIILLMELFTVLFASGDLMEFIRFAVVILLGAFLVLIPMKRRQVATLCTAYVVSTVFICVDLLYSTFSRITINDFFDRGYRFGNLSSFVDESQMSSLSTFNPNGFVLIITVAIYLLSVLWYIRRVSFLMYVPVALMLAFCAVMTQSRGGLFAMALFFVLLFVGFARDFKGFLKISFIYVFIATVFLLLISGPLADLYGRILYRFSVEDITSGRGDIWRDIISAQFSNLNSAFFGFGRMNYRFQIGEFTAHNTILDVFSSWGIVGLGLVAAWHVYAVFRQRKIVGRRIPIIYYAPYFAMLFNSMSGQYYAVVIYSMLFSLLQVALRLAEYDECHFMSRVQARQFYRKEKEEWQYQEGKLEREVRRGLSR